MRTFVYLFIVVGVVFSFYAVGAIIFNVPKNLELNHIFFEIAYFVIIPFFIFFVIARKASVAALLISVVYSLWFALNVSKQAFLGSAVLPADFAQLGELFDDGWSIVKQFFFPVIGLVVLIVMLIKLVSREARPVMIQNRWGWFLLLLLVQVSIPVIHIKAYPLIVNVNNSFNTGLRKGFVSHFMTVLLGHNEVRRPDGYSQEAICNILAQYGVIEKKGKNQHIEPASASLLNQEPQKHLNLITLMVESLTIPRQMDWEFTEDPTPNLSAMLNTAQVGYLLSPVYGGKSTNAEFEFLSGLSLAYIPPEKKPFRAYMRNTLPSLAGELKKQGYQTYGVQTVGVRNYYASVYEYLGIEKSISLRSKDVPRDRTGKPNDHAVIGQLIDLMKSNDRYYIHAFPNSTHAPWSGRWYGPKRIRLMNTAGLSLSDINHIEGYANALKEFDNALGQLLKFLKEDPRPTVLAIVGDHQPGISVYSKWFDQNLREQIDDNEKASYLAKHFVPFIIWRNYEPEDKQIKPFRGSMNMAPVILSRALEIEERGFMKFLSAVFQKSPYSSRIYKQGSEFTDKPPPDQKRLLSDYEIIQYDLLHGENYFFEITQNNSC